MYSNLRGILPPVERTGYQAEAALRHTLKIGLWLAAGVVFGLGGFAAMLTVSGAIVAPGEVNVASQVKRIAHPTGGVVANIFVSDGDHVHAGQPLMKLDSTISGATAMLTDESLDQLRAHEARLLAERDAASTVSFPSTLTGRRGAPAVDALLKEEQRVFALRSEARLGQTAQLAQRIRQSEAEIAGLHTQIESVRGQSAFIGEELAAARELWTKRYTTLQRLSALERTAVALKGNEAALRTQVAQSRAKIAEVRQQMISLNQEARSRAGTELSEVQARLSELRQRKVAADDLNGRNIIRAPARGVVDKLAFPTIGGVVPAGTTIMVVVPDSDRLMVRARIRPTDIDQVVPGETVSLRFSAFNARTTPQIEGQVERVSADRATDPDTGAGYYTAEIAIPAFDQRRLGDLKLRPGMPVEAFIRTGDRTMLNYIVKPLGDQLQRAFREN